MPHKPHKNYRNHNNRFTKNHDGWFKNVLLPSLRETSDVQRCHAQGCCVSRAYTRGERLGPAFPKPYELSGPMGRSDSSACPHHTRVLSLSAYLSYGAYCCRYLLGKMTIGFVQLGGDGGDVFRCVAIL